MPESKQEQGGEVAKSDSKQVTGSEGGSKIEFEKKPKLSKQERRELQVTTKLLISSVQKMGKSINVDTYLVF